MWRRNLRLPGLPQQSRSQSDTHKQASYYARRAKRAASPQCHCGNSQQGGRRGARRQPHRRAINISPPITNTAVRIIRPSTNQSRRSCAEGRRQPMRWSTATPFRRKNPRARPCPGAASPFGRAISEESAIARMRVVRLCRRQGAKSSQQGGGRRQGRRSREEFDD